MSSTKLLTSFSILIIILLFSYDLLTYLSVLLSLKIIKLIYFSVLIILYLGLLNNKNETPKFTKDIFFSIILVFSILYLIRIFVDLYILNIVNKTYEGRFTYLFLFINSVILPLFFLKKIDYSKINFIKLYKYLIILLLVSCAISINEISKNGFIGNRYDANISLDTISFGHIGITLFLVGSTLLLNSIQFINKVIYISIMLFGLFIAMLANSRSPFVALISCILFYIIVIKRSYFIYLIFGLFILSFIFINEITIILEYFGTGFIDRFTMTLSEYNSEDVTSGRTNIYKISIDEFVNNPFFGNSFLIESAPFTGEYPHNVIIDSLIALGFFGGVLFITSVIITFRNSIRIIKLNQKYLFISLLFIQYFIYSMFSRSLTNLPVLWLSMFLVNYIKVNEINKIKLSNKLF